MDAAGDGSTKSPMVAAADVDRMIRGAGLEDEQLGRFAVYFPDHKEKVLCAFQRLVAYCDQPAPAAVKAAVEQLLQGGPVGPPAAGAAGTSTAADDLRDRFEQLQKQVSEMNVPMDIIAALLTYDEDNMSVATIPEFKAALMDKYSTTQMRGISGREVTSIFCMALKKHLPKRHVTAAHLWKRAWAKLLVSVPNFTNLDDINDVRNGLLLFKPIEWAFDTGRLIILHDAGFGTFRMHIMDHTIRDVQLVDKLVELCQRHPAVEITDAEWSCIDGANPRTFGDLHNQLILDCRRNPPSPMTRILYFHAQLNLRQAVKKGWSFVPPDIKPSNSPGSWKYTLHIFFNFLDEHDRRQHESIAAAATSMAQQLQLDNNGSPKDEDSQPHQLGGSSAVAVPHTSQDSIIRPPWMSKSARKKLKRRRNKQACKAS